MSGYEGSSFAPFNTGNPQWDQNFNSLSRGLFGDPSGYARGLAAGATARENIIKGDTSISERNAAASQLLMALGLDRTGRPQLPPTPTFHPSGVPGGAPIMDPPAGMQMSAPPPVSSISPPGFLARLFGAGDHPNDKGVGTTGTPPPASSPAPNAGAPPAPNTTTSNGQVPTNDQGSGPFNYNAINTTGGGRQYAPAAQSNGAPAPVPINLGSLMALGAYAGQPADVIKQGGQAYIASAFEHGLVPWNTANQAASTGPTGAGPNGVVGAGATELSSLIGNNAPYESDAATGRTKLAEAGATTREGMRLGQQESQFVRTAQPGMVTTDASGNPIVNLPPPKGSTTLVPVGRGFNEPLEQQRREPFTTGGGGPFGSGPQVSTKGAAPGQPGYDDVTNRMNNTPVKYVDKDGTIKGTVYGDYLQLPPGSRPPLTPDSVEALRSAAITAGMGTGNMDPAAKVRAGTIASTPAGDVKGEEALITDELLKDRIEARYAPSEHPLDNKLPARLDANGAASVRARAADIMRDPNASAAAHNNVSVATDQAISELIAAGQISPDVDRGKGVSTMISNPNARELKDRGASQGVFIVPSKGQYQPGALGLAPKGGQENQLVDIGGGRKGRVHNGFVYPYQ